MELSSNNETAVQVSDDVQPSLSTEQNSLSSKLRKRLPEDSIFPNEEKWKKRLRGVR